MKTVDNVQGTVAARIEQLERALRLAAEGGSVTPANIARAAQQTGCDPNRLANVYNGLDEATRKMLGLPTASSAEQLEHTVQDEVVLDLFGPHDAGLSLEQRKHQVMKQMLGSLGDALSRSVAIFQA